MRLRNVPGSRETIADHPLCILEEDPQAGSWKDIFGNDHPIHIEVGMGKGTFITTLALQNPEINYIGIEKYSSVLVRALEKADAINALAGEDSVEAAEMASLYGCDALPADGLTNIRFIRMDAENICQMFTKDEVDQIYLNFSDPWPKDRHAKRRLTSTTFLGRYDKILVKDGHVEFKTDNQDLFAFSLEQVEPAGWHLDAFTRDLHHEESMNQGNIMTEYEKKFSEMGNPICKMIISR